MNSTFLAGRICSVPKIRLIRPSDRVTNVCSFVLSVPDDSFENTKRNVDFFECISFGAVASMINGSFVKGCKVILTGKFKNYCFYDCNKTRHFTQVFVISRIENGDTASSFEKNVGSKSMEKTIEADLKDIYDSFDEVVKSGFVCVDEDDYYRLAFNSAPSI